MNRGRTRQPTATFSLPNFIITIIITTTIITTDMGMDMGPGMDMDPASRSCRDTGVITTIITTITITASIPATEVVSYGMTIKQDLRVLFFCVAQGCSAGPFASREPVPTPAPGPRECFARKRYSPRAFSLAAR